VATLAQSEIREFQATAEGEWLQSPLQRIGLIGAAIALWLGLTDLITGTNLLKPYFVFEPSAKVLLFLLLNAFAAGVYAAVQRWATGWRWRVCFTIACVAVASLDMSVVYFLLEPVMLSELITQRLFYHYMEAVRVATMLGGSLLAGVLLARSGYMLQRGTSSRSVALLPVAFGIAFSGKLVQPTTAVAVLACAAAMTREFWITSRILETTKSFRDRAGSLLTRDRVVVWSCFLFAFLTRAVYAVRTAASEQANGFVWDDAGIYEQGARDLSYEGYSLFLRAIYSVTGHSFIAVRVVQALLGALICVLIYRLAMLIAGRTVALLAMFLALANGVLLLIPAMQARETLLTFLLLAGVYYSLKWRDDSTAHSIAAGILFGLLGLVKVIAVPAALLAAWLRRPSMGTDRLRQAGTMIAVAVGLVATKAIVNRPLDVPVGRSGGQYAAMAYFAGNHPFAAEERWFSLTAEQYRRLAAMGFQVSPRAGEPDVVSAWNAQHPRIAYCDPVTFETNTVQLVRYNLTHPTRLAQITAENFVAFFLGKLHHHRKFDTLYLLNDSAFSYLSRLFWILLAIPGWMYAWLRSGSDPLQRNALIVAGAVIGYFTAVYTIMIGTSIYSIPLVPYLIILQSAGLCCIWQTLRKDTLTDPSDARHRVKP
jgi:hypothetical protein